VSVAPSQRPADAPDAPGIRIGANRIVRVDDGRSARVSASSDKSSERLVASDEPTPLRSLPTGDVPLGRAPSAGLRAAAATWRPASIFVGSRALVLLVVAATASVTHTTVAKILTSWDSQWYLRVARNGYAHAIPPGHGNVAQSDLGFFPLLPLIIRGFHGASWLDWDTSAIAACFVIGLLATVAVWWLLCDVLGADRADRGTALVVLSPGAFILSFVYSEGLVVLLVSCCLIALRHRKWLVAGVCAGLATGADPVAIAVLAPCAVAAYDAVRERREWRSILAPCMAPLGMIGFFSYLWAHTGTPLEWLDAQRAGWQSGYFFSSVPKAVAGVFTTGLSDLNPVVKAASFVVAIIVVVLFVRWRPPRTWLVYAIAVITLGMMSPIVGVTPRLLVRDAPLLGFVGAKMSVRAFAWVLPASAMICAALTVLASSIRFTP
jgi:Glycosyltransferase family 87